MKNILTFIYIFIVIVAHTQKNQIFTTLYYDKITTNVGSNSLQPSTFKFPPALLSGSMGIGLERILYKKISAQLEVGYALYRAKPIVSTITENYSQHQMYLSMTPQYEIAKNVKLGVGLLYKYSLSGDLIALRKNHMAYHISLGYTFNKFTAGIRFTNYLTPYQGGDKQPFSAYWVVYSAFLKYQLFSF